MSENLKPPMPENASSAVVSEQLPNSGLSSEALARRRMLLKSLGKGSAVVAASVPLRTLAQNSILVTPKGKDGAAQDLRCSVSGMQSGVHSNDTGQKTTCNGRRPEWWGEKTIDMKGKTIPSNTWPYANPAEVYSFKFGRVTLTQTNFRNPSLFEVMSVSDYANTTTRHWIGAWLNGLHGQNNFPYSGEKILEFYGLSDTDPRRINAYKLITTYLEML